MVHEAWGHGLKRLTISPDGKIPDANEDHRRLYGIPSSPATEDLLKENSVYKGQVMYEVVKEILKAQGRPEYKFAPK